VPGGEDTKTFYVLVNHTVFYVTIAAMGNVTFTTNTTGWYALLAKLGEVAPIGSSGTFPWGYINATLKDGSVLKLYNYNTTHGFVVRDVGMWKYAWAAQIIKVGGFYVWYPVVADNQLRDYIGSVLGMYIRLYEPSINYLAFDGTRLYIYADCFDGSWHVRGCFTSIPLSSFTQLSPNSNYVVEGAERVGNVYIYWPVFVIYYMPHVGGNYTTYLHVAVGSSG